MPHRTAPWGWRIPFLLSIVLLAVGILVRHRLDESPEFRRVKENQRITRLMVYLLRVDAIGALTAVAWAFPIFLLVDTGDVAAAALAFFGAAIVQAIMAGAQGALFTELFHTQLRFSGASVAHQLGGLVGGAVGPLVSTSLFGAYHSSTPIALYLAAICVVGPVAVLPLRTTVSLAEQGKVTACGPVPAE